MKNKSIIYSDLSRKQLEKLKEFYIQRYYDNFRKGISSILNIESPDFEIKNLDYFLNFSDEIIINLSKESLNLENEILNFCFPF